MGIQKNIILRPEFARKKPLIYFYYLKPFWTEKTKNKKETTDFQIIRN
jgi:hypothetical protein